MRAPIANKARVLETLQTRLEIAEAVIQHSIANGEPPGCQKRGREGAADLREAIRFIEEHSE